MSTKKRINEPFTSVPNSLINNKNISTGAKGMFLFLYSKPNDWSFSEEKIKNQIKESETFIKRVLKELEKFGYLERKKILIKGQNKGINYILNIIPKETQTNVIKTNVIKTNVGKTNVGKPISYSNKDISNKENKKEIERELSHFDFLKFNYLNEVTDIETEYKNKFNAKEWEFMIEKFNDYYLNKNVNVSITKLKKWIKEELEFNKKSTEVKIQRPDLKRLNDDKLLYRDKIF